ncbi:ABC transporter permease [Paenibacillus macquariensis]|uniref:Glycine betaine/proline transport system permease protein/glycine betaine/proline transport system substrate-binding protein n=1 Tax=Paenibacillus macquariensis TaxID=948756 RepID=A0ABY1K4W7_9BACL|nr:proline/glycine betaine ABC transporter permease [Paenibacillus macquariensis]MEC0089094.1 proline/glycine betaine ABC transporter permease [Paenibacillus macquariensis]OAB31784.1 glycine/betaine ABC transporter [Paenibacillus macquariensis subsp. macquariensis]SIR26036.1 glycine betaine/proline transport system permease protein/glycine betaine/proline transport system substrate-binding protein [Paenibacillus macquariensis]
MSVPKIPIGEWVESLEGWLETNFEPFFDGVKLVVGSVVDGLADGFNFFPPLVMIAIFTVIAFWLGRYRLGAFTLLGLLLVHNLGYWEHTMDTLALVLTASFISIVVGVPVGILCAGNKKVQSVVTPLLDLMQTMPAFVYLLPAVAFFSLGVVPGVIASVIFSIPPTIRLTSLGIRQVPEDLVEAADAFGSTRMQKLIKVQLPIAIPTIMAGINQTIMLSLSMVVIASMIGAQGVGADVYRAVTQAKTGMGTEAGLAVVVLAIMLDRMTQKLAKKNKKV